MSKINLCDHCIRWAEFPLCIDRYVEFGDGVGNDNIIKCNRYIRIDESVGGTNDNINE